MGVRQLIMSGDTSALEKQLNLKTKQILELQEKLDLQSRQLFDASDSLENKDRGTYYLERTIDARNRELTLLKKECDELEPAAASSGFGPKIEQGERAVADAKAAEAEIIAEIEACELRTKACKFQTEKFAAVMKRVDSGALRSAKVLDELESQHKALIGEISKQKSEIEELKGDLVTVEEEVEVVKGRTKFLDQYRVDSIFRIFTLKGKIQVLKMKLANDEYN